MADREKVIIKLKEEEVQKFRDHMDRVDRNVHTGIGKLIAETVVYIYRDTVTPASFPVVTGFLRSSYNFESDDNQGEVFSHADYAPMIEDRSPHLFPALKTHEQRFYAAVDKLLKRNL